jgi:hypothetical protein
MDLEAQEGTQNFHSGTHSKFTNFFAISLLLHIIGLGFFFKKNTNPFLSDKKIVIHLSGGEKTQILKQKNNYEQAKLSTHKKTQNSFATLSHPISERFSNTKDDTLTSAANFEAVYPRLSRIFKEQGEVVFKIKKSDHIEKLSFEMIKSSSHKRLDHAAEEALETNKKKILTLIQDQNIEHIRFEFKLTRKEP